MAVVTAQMIIGHGHGEHGAVEPAYYAFLSENGRPAWILVPENITSLEQKHVRGKIVWIPTDSDILEDGLLMIAVHVIREQTVRSVAETTFRNPYLSELQLLKQVSGEARRSLYQMCRSLTMHYKIVMTVFEGSALMPQLQVLKDYSWNVDVHLLKYSRYYSHRANEFITRGTLDDL